MGFSSSGFSSGTRVTRSFWARSKMKAIPSRASFRLTVGWAVTEDREVEVEVGRETVDLVAPFFSG
jgi:hypothetical protein